MIPVAHSITHQHIASVVNTLLEGRAGGEVVRILDIGCGDGRLVAHLLHALPALRPDLRFDVYGMDVSDAGQQVGGFFTETVRLLASEHPGLAWEERLALVTTSDRWPYPDGRFDFITSNQVMEHVMDHAFVFGEIRRCLRPGGCSINLFPTKEILWEGHAKMPIVHRIRGVERRTRAMRLFAGLGFREHYHREMERRGWKSLDEFAHVFARVLETDTNYLTTRQLAEAARGVGLDIAFTFTKDFFAAKVLSYAGRRPYRYRDWGPLEPLLFRAGRRLSSVTVLLRPQGTAR